MAHIIVKLSFNAAGQIATDPNPVKVSRGDTVAWTSDEGDVSITLADAPLEGARKFSGRKGQHTDQAKIRSDARPGHFDCTASIGGKEAPAYGIDIQP